MAEVKHVTISTPIEEILNIIDEDAGVIIDGFLNTKQIDQIKNDLDPFLKNTRKGQDQFSGSGILFLSHLCEPGTSCVAPFAFVKSFIAQTVLNWVSIFLGI